MKRILLSLVGALISTALVLYLFKAPLKEWLYAEITEDMFVAADNDNFDPGPAIGSHFPGVRALHEGREISLLTSLAGHNGTVLVASRSLDWCPYCMKQMIQLNDHHAEFQAAGIGLVGVTYDSPAQQRAFARKFGISIPLLSDIDVMTFKTLGIVNEQYQPGDDHYGIPHPGMIIIDRNGLVVGKLFIEGYSTRIDSASALTFARQVLGLADNKYQ